MCRRQLPRPVRRPPRLPRSYPLHQSILFRDLRGGRDEASIAVNFQEVTVGKPDGTGGLADDNVHPVVIFPNLSDLYFAEVDWLAKGVDYLFADEIVECLTLILFQRFFFGLFDLELVWHGSPPR